MIANENKGWGGAEEHTLRLAVSLKQRGHGVVLITPPISDLGDRAALLGVETRRVPMRNEVDVSSVLRIAGILRSEAADVLHTVGTRDHVLGALAAAFTGTPVVKAEHTYLGVGSSALCLNTYRRRTDAVVCVCSAMKSHVSAMGIPIDRLRVITNGIDTDQYAPQICGISRVDEPKIVIVASFLPDKGHRCLIAAFGMLADRYPSIRLLCAGDGPLQKEIMELADRSGVAAQVDWLGSLQNVRPAILSSDLLVHPSLKEALPYAIMEAMACGKPVVAADVGGVSELVVDGKTGILVPPGDEKRLADAVSIVLEDAGLRSSMGIAGRERVLKQFTIERMIHDYESLYSGLVKRDGK